MKSLSPKQQKLADCILQGMTLARAHEAAGYSGKDDASRKATASEILTNPNVAAYMKRQKAEAVEKASNELAITKKWVLGRLRETVKLGQSFGSDGKPLGLSASNQALSLIGKELGMFVDRSETTVKDLAQMSVSDLMIEREQARRRLKEVMTRYGVGASLNGNQCCSADDPVASPSIHPH